MRKNMTLLSSNKKNMLHVAVWRPDGQPKAVIQIVHGMVEYIERYSDFAEYLTQNGFLVIGHDHLGHGQSVQSVEDWGYIGDDHPSDILTRDIHRVRRLGERLAPGLPYFILGHSMGSYLLRKYLTYRGSGLQGAVIMGTGAEPDSATMPGLMLVRSMAKIRGWRHRSKKVQDMTYSSPYRIYDVTGKDPENSWLTKDTEIVKSYYTDPRCCFTFTLSGYEALLSTVLFDNKKKYIKLIPKDLPVLFTSGSMDPVGNMGTGVKRAAKLFQDAGILDVSVKLYADDRHEILNELDRDVVYADLVKWFDQRL